MLSQRYQNDTEARWELIVILLQNFSSECLLNHPQCKQKIKNWLELPGDITCLSNVKEGLNYSQFWDSWEVGQ